MEIIFHSYAKLNSFSQERLCTWPHFRSEGFWNSEVAYYIMDNHNYKKIVKSDWLSTTLISALIGQFNRTVRVMPK